MRYSDAFKISQSQSMVQVSFDCIHTTVNTNSLSVRPTYESRPDSKCPSLLSGLSGLTDGQRLFVRHLSRKGKPFTMFVRLLENLLIAPTSPHSNAIYLYYFSHPRIASNAMS